MEKIISFIIPSYNVENCLPVCLDSFLIQESEGFSQLEVIVVDDGSRDRTAEIAGSYVKRFPSVYRLIQKENGGHGSAINAGSQAASGKYMKVVDADDWVVTENLGELLKKLAKCHSDVVLTPFHQVHMKDGSREIWKMYCPEYEVEYSLGISIFFPLTRTLTAALHSMGSCTGLSFTGIVVINFRKRSFMKTRNTPQSRAVMQRVFIRSTFFYTNIRLEMRSRVFRRLTK